MKKSLSIILPAKNEAGALDQVLRDLLSHFPQAEIIVVDDGSTDATEEICNKYPIRHIKHQYSMGNGASIKHGAKAANGEILVFMDADGQHKPEDIQPLLDKLNQGYDMVVGERDASSQASLARRLANGFYNKLATRITGHKIKDLTSGFRAVRAEKFRQFVYLLPNGFSYPTTITMSFFRAGYQVAYVPIKVNKRIGKSHINLLTDGTRFFLIIFKIGTLYSPLKIFFPVSTIFFLTGISYYAYTYITAARFTNMGVLLFIMAVIVFLIGLVSEQITNLMYQSSDK